MMICNLLKTQYKMHDLSMITQMYTSSESSESLDPSIIMQMLFFFIFMMRHDLWRISSLHMISSHNLPLKTRNCSALVYLVISVSFDHAWTFWSHELCCQEFVKRCSFDTQCCWCRIPETYLCERSHLYVALGRQALNARIFCAL